MTVLSLLFLGRARLRDGWTQGAHARNADGRMHRFDMPGPAATAYSAHGAVGGHDVLLMMHARIRLWETLGDRQIGYANLADWNDAPERTAAEVMALYEDAIVAEARA